MLNISKVHILTQQTYEIQNRHLRHRFNLRIFNVNDSNHNCTIPMTTHIIQRARTLYLVEPINSEFLRLTPLNGGETFERSIEDYERLDWMSVKIKK